MDLRAQYSVLRTHRLIVVGSIVLAMLAALVVSLASPKVYSQATLIVGQSLSSANPDLGQIDTSQRLSATYAQIATTRPILEAVIAKLGLAIRPRSCWKPSRLPPRPTAPCSPSRSASPIPRLPPRSPTRSVRN